MGSTQSRHKTVKRGDLWHGKPPVILLTVGDTPPTPSPPPLIAHGNADELTNSCIRKFTTIKMPDARLFRSSYLSESVWWRLRPRRLCCYGTAPRLSVKKITPPGEKQLLCCTQMGLDLTTEEFSAPNCSCHNTQPCHRKDGVVKYVLRMCSEGAALLLSSVQPVQLRN